MKPFVDRHREELIRRVTVVDPILDDIKDLLTTEHYEYIRSRPTSQEKMEVLFGYVSVWSDGDKEILYNSLKKHNRLIIRDLEEKEEVPPVREFESRFPGRAGGLDDAPDIDIAFDFVPPVPEKRPKISSDIVPPVPVPPVPESTWGFFYPEDFHLDCELCGKDEDSVYLVMPNINGREYRLELHFAGLFRCSKTGIKFQVTRPVTIVYELDSWRNYETLIRSLQSGYEILGPLFNIKTDLEPGVVSAVYLPHSLCLKGFKEDTSVIKCAHLKYNITLEAPTRVEPYYVVLENPTFSPIGVLLYPLMWLKDRITKFIPFHGMVLIYWRISGITDPDHRMFRIHLFLMPCNLSVEMDIQSQEKNLGYERIRKPPQTASLYIRTMYDVKASQNASVSPEMLLFRCSYVSELYPFTEITVDGKNTSEEIAISLEDGNISVWKTKVDKGDIMDLKSAMSGLSVQEGAIGGMAGPSVVVPCLFRKSTEMLHSYPVKGDAEDFPTSREHFVDQHRLALIDAIALVKPILEELRSLDLLTDEHYDTVCSKPTSQEQMRELYRYIRSWGDGDKDKIYQILRKHNRPVINRLWELAQRSVLPF